MGWGLWSKAMKALSLPPPPPVLTLVQLTWWWVNFILLLLKCSWLARSIAWNRLPQIVCHDPQGVESRFWSRGVVSSHRFLKFPLQFLKYYLCYDCWRPASRVISGAIYSGLHFSAGKGPHVQALVIVTLVLSFTGTKQQQQDRTGNSPPKKGPPGWILRQISRSPLWGWVVLLNLGLVLLLSQNLGPVILSQRTVEMSK